MTVGGIQVVSPLCGPSFEARDCTVRALAAASGMPYSRAHHVLARAGRKNGRGINSVKFCEVLMSHGFWPCWPTVPEWRGRVLDLLPALAQQKPARWVVVVTGHAFAVRGDKVFDFPRRMPLRAWVRDLYYGGAL